MFRRVGKSGPGQYFLELVHVNVMDFAEFPEINVPISEFHVNAGIEDTGIHMFVVVEFHKRCIILSGHRTGKKFRSAMPVDGAGELPGAAFPA